MIGNDGMRTSTRCAAAAVRRCCWRSTCWSYNGNDLRDLPLIERKKQLRRLIGKAKRWRAIQYVDHITGDGPTVFGMSAAWGWRASCRSG